MNSKDHSESYRAFPRGFLVTDRDLSRSESPALGDAVETWEKVDFPGASVYHDPALTAFTHSGWGTSVMLLGTAIDPFGNVNDGRIITERMHELWRKSPERFLDYLDQLSGRFVVLVASGGKTHILQDAAGIKTAFYDSVSDDIAVSSHCRVVAELMGYKPTLESRTFRQSAGYTRTVSYFPGITTPYREVKMLTPNTMLEIKQRRIDRFYPRSPLRMGPISEDTVEELSNLFVAQVGLLAGKHSLAIPLSGGIDSRITLGAAFGCGVKDVPCYTFVENREHELDARVASRLCSDLGYRHITVPTRGREAQSADDEDFMRSWRLTTAGMRGDSQGLLCRSLLKSLPARDLHLRSTVSEVGRAFYRKKVRLLPSREISPARLARYYSINPGWESVTGAFREYMDITQFKEESIFNYDPCDMFYWEHRNGAWQSLAIMDFDMALDTFILFNNRRILEKMLSVPLADRLNDRLHKALIDKMVANVSEAPLIYSLKPFHLRVGKSALKKVKYGLESITDKWSRPYRFNQD